MITPPHPDDAFNFIVDRLRNAPDRWKQPSNSEDPQYDVSLPSLVWEFLQETKQAEGIGFSDIKNEDRTKEVWRAFYDAAWRLCRMGILRPTVRWSRHTSVGAPAAGDGYSYTILGREWLANSELAYVPSDPRRYVQILEEESKRLGPGFLQRTQEAAGCHQNGNHLACCAMSGAAAESAILAVAIEKTGDEKTVLDEYIKPNGRHEVLRRVFGGKASDLDKRFISSAFYLLAFWRDEAAHGQVSEISELDAHHALTSLMRLAQYLCGQWDRLTASA